MKIFLQLLLCLGYFTVNTVFANTNQDSPEVLLGERLFLETRFAQFFKTYLDKGGETNRPLAKGDPILDKTQRFFDLPPYQIPFAQGPFKGQSFNCRACHLVDEHTEQKELGMRSYSDFAARSPLPLRDDGRVTTVRNAPALVDAAFPRNNFLMHFDGEFYSLPQLVKGTLTDRNFGWLPGEKSIAIEHICRIIREDNGTNALAMEFGGLSYTEAFIGKHHNGKSVSADYLLPAAHRIDIKNSSCEKIFSAVANLISVYTTDLVFAEDETILSPYDLFLNVNKLPRRPSKDETDLAYSKRLVSLINGLKQKNKLTFIKENPNTSHGGFEFHDQTFEFGPKQLEGLEIFFNQDEQNELSVGNCIACHAAPHFTDFGLHNTGVTQVEYDAVHGLGKFNKLDIPDLVNRNKQADLYLPATHTHPDRQGLFRSIPDETNPLLTDLGTWNIFYNDDYARSQQSIQNIICTGNTNPCDSDDHALERSIATFKTPGLRDLGHSAPYMHNGQISDLDGIIFFYIKSAAMARQGTLRNSDEKIESINLTAKDVSPLVAFLISLYEDYN